MFCQILALPGKDSKVYPLSLFSKHSLLSVLCVVLPPIAISTVVHQTSNPLQSFVVGASGNVLEYLSFHGVEFSDLTYLSLCYSHRSLFVYSRWCQAKGQLKYTFDLLLCVLFHSFNLEMLMQSEPQLLHNELWILSI